MRTRTVQRIIGWAIFGIFVISVLTWHYTRDVMPGEIRIATAVRGGLYHKLAEALTPHLRKRSGSYVHLLETEGTGENRRLLLDGEAELAVIQSGSVPMDGLTALAPLYREPILVVCRADAAITDIRDLAGRNVAIGPPGSGMRDSALRLLAHYRIDADGLGRNGSYFLDLLDDDSLEAAIITTGLVNPDLEQLLGSGRFRLIPILDADAFCLRHPSFEEFSVPRGLYAEGPPVPFEPVTTVATTAFLAAGAGVSDLLVNEALIALYENDLRADVPTLLSPAEARLWPQQPLHPVARRYLDPYGGIELLARFLDTLAATKELLFALGAALYLLWLSLRGMRQRERERELSVMKERLDAMLDETASIERSQMKTTDPDKLKEYLDNVTRIKLRAIDELTHEDLRSDQMFAIFLMQCGNLINKIQSKIARN